MSKSWKEVRKRVLSNPLVKQYYDKLQREFDLVREEPNDVSTLDEISDELMDYNIIHDIDEL